MCSSDLNCGEKLAFDLESLEEDDEEDEDEDDD